MLDRPSEISQSTNQEAASAKTDADLVSRITSIRYCDKGSALKLLSKFEKTLKEENAANEMLEFFSLLNDDDLTFGMTIARYQKNDDDLRFTEFGNPTIKYIMLLKTLLKRDVDPQEIYSILLLQDMNGWNFGGLVAYFQNDEATLAHIDLLCNLLKRGIDAKDIFSLLMLRNRTDGNTFCLAVVYQQYGRIYKNSPLERLFFLFKGLYKGGISADSFTALFEMVNSNKCNLGLELVFFQDEEAVMAYLDFLIFLLQSGGKPESILKILKQQDINGSTIVSELVALPEREIERKFFFLLSALVSLNIDVIDLFRSILLQGKREREHGIIFVYSQHAETAALFCQLLKDLVLFSASTNDFEKVLQLKDKKGCPLLLLLIRGINNEKVTDCIEVLRNLTNAGTGFETMLKILRLCDKNGLTIGMELALRTQYKQAFSYYLNFLEDLLERTSNKDRLGKLFASDSAPDPFTGKQTWTLTDFVMQAQEVNIMFRLITSGLLPDGEYRKFAPKLNEILNYIISSKATGKKLILKNALNQEHPLGKLFYQDYYNKDCIQMRKRIMEELVKLQMKTKEKMKFNLFYPGQNGKKIVGDQQFCEYSSRIAFLTIPHRDVNNLT